MYNRNSKKEIHKWIKKCINDAEDVEDEVLKQMLIEGTKLANRGYWRGDISEMWINRFGINSANISDLYP